MWCINLGRLAMAILWTLTIFNFVAIFNIIIFAIPAWNKIANKIFPYRSCGSYEYSEIDEINEKVNELKREIRAIKK
jgi:hypothetical protein